MKGLNLLILFTSLAGCSLPQQRHPASMGSDIGYRSISLQLSSIAPASFEQDLEYFIQLKDEDGRGTDLQSPDLILKNNKGREIPFLLERSRRGSYYLVLKERLKPVEFPLKLFYQGAAFEDQLDCYTQKAHKSKSGIFVEEETHQRVKLRLELRDAKGHLISMSKRPEIILQGEGEVEEILPLSPGIWQFSIIYPDDNAIMYLSVRTHNALLERMLRLQYVAK
jgi:hypothetical protein